MDDVLSTLIIGLSRGSILFLLATGLSLTMGLMRIVNMAHGALYMMGAFVGVWVAQQVGSFWIGALAAGVCAAVIGLTIETGFLRPLYKQEAAQVLLTIGFIYILIGVAWSIWGTLPQSGIKPSIFSGTVQVGSASFSWWRIFLIGFGLVMALALWVFQDKTKVGAKVRAGMDSREVASSLGVNLRVLFTGVFVLGSFVAGLMGLFGSETYQVEASLAWRTLLLSLIVVVVGGAGSIQGALLGGLLLGLVQAFGEAYAPKTAAYLVYVVLVITLLFRPSGLLGRKASGGEQTSDALERAYVYAHKPPRKLKATALAAKEWSPLHFALKKYLPYAIAIVLLVGIPFLIGDFEQDLMARVLVFAIFAMSLDLLMGYTGLLSFGHAAFFGMGGYVIAVLLRNTDLSSFWILFPAAIVLTLVLALVIGALSLRVSGIYFLLVTMAFGQLLYVVAEKWTSLTRGKSGIPVMKNPDLWFGSRPWTNLAFYFFVFVIFALCFYLMRRFTRSAYGKTLVGIRDNEERMKSMGYNTWGAKYGVIAVAAMFAGVAGALYVFQNNTIVPSDFALDKSALPMLMVIIGGMGTLWGPALGAAVIVLAEYYFSRWFGDVWYIVLGALFVVSVMFLRGGLARVLTRFWDWLWGPPSPWQRLQALRARSAGIQAPEYAEGES